MQVPEIDETIKRISSQRGVLGVIVTNKDGILRTTIDQTSTIFYVNGMTTLHARCSSAIRELDPTNELDIIRVRTKKFEIMSMCGENHMLMIIQTPRAR